MKRIKAVRVYLNKSIQKPFRADGLLKSRQKNKRFFSFFTHTKSWPLLCEALQEPESEAHLSVSHVTTGEPFTWQVRILCYPLKPPHASHWCLSQSLQQQIKQSSGPSNADTVNAVPHSSRNDIYFWLCLCRLGVSDCWDGRRSCSFSQRITKKTLQIWYSVFWDFSYYVLDWENPISS